MTMGGGIHALSEGRDSGLGPRRKLEALEGLGKDNQPGAEKFFSSSLFLRFSAVVNPSEVANSGEETGT